MPCLRHASRERGLVRSGGTILYSSKFSSERWTFLALWLSVGEVGESVAMVQQPCTGGCFSVRELVSPSYGTKFSWKFWKSGVADCLRAVFALWAEPPATSSSLPDWKTCGPNRQSSDAVGLLFRSLSSVKIRTTICARETGDNWGARKTQVWPVGHSPCCFLPLCDQVFHWKPSDSVWKCAKL